ncbi:unnamed protein product [Chondrus crispus]|uniref:Peptidase S9 prolyl oligopeptidase catalytic domain-containing protein n=1 Tax=Chondrus crispus TaxID=2769 RepID=R7Q9M6_CHOCR|nr:unnamed protein product [Chondrus crispus]CDF35242.1 unnamed protein product [Chondrus crispus]|eukprot:XP_005715061.1 unnamed protein product [Chondrus crispus]
MPGFILIPRGTFAFFLFALFSFSNASTDIPIARHYRAFGPLPYTSSERGLEPLKVLPFYSTVLDTLLSLKTFPSESAVGGKASWRDCPYNKSAKGVITAPFPDADRHLPYNAWAVANFSIQKYIGRPHLVQCSNPATIKLRQAFPSFESRVNLSSPSSEISCPGDVYEDGRSICSARLWPGSYQILVQLSSFSNSSSFYCNFFTDPAGLSSNLLLTIDDIVTPHVVLKMRNDRAVATLAGAHCSFTLMNTHDQEWATGGSAELRDAPDGLKLRPQSQSDSHFPLPRIAPRQVHQLRIDFFTEPDFLNQTAADGRLPESLNITIAVSYQIADAQHESLIELSFDVAVWSELTSYHFTYIDVDGSVQAAAVLPPRQNCVGAPAGDDKCSVLLSTHGAGVDAVGRAWTESYQVQNQSWVLLPTGRRKFGMNWEGPQLNSAITALRKFAEDLPGVPTDEKDLWKVRGDRWLQAGHSMGGHGALLLSTHYPDMLVAALPAMGWLRLSTSGEAAYKEQLPYSDAASRALLSLASSEYSADLYAENLLGIPFLARVGSDDDNVPRRFSFRRQVGRTLSIRIASY